MLTLNKLSGIRADLVISIVTVFIVKNLGIKPVTSKQ